MKGSRSIFERRSESGEGSGLLLVVPAEAGRWMNEGDKGVDREV
jgi:hypothetical protein